VNSITAVQAFSWPLAADVSDQSADLYDQPDLSRKVQRSLKLTMSRLTTDRPDKWASEADVLSDGQRGSVVAAPGRKWILNRHTLSFLSTQLWSTVWVITGQRPVFVARQHSAAACMHTARDVIAASSVPSV